MHLQYHRQLLQRLSYILFQAKTDPHTWVGNMVCIVKKGAHYPYLNSSDFRNLLDHLSVFINDANNGRSWFDITSMEQCAAQARNIMGVHVVNQFDQPSRYIATTYPQDHSVSGTLNVGKLSTHLGIPLHYYERHGRPSISPHLHETGLLGVDLRPTT
ncbi:hypothetical protein HYALB_00004607 [Hymenoscyphus albidus]|uniref:Uncharacterized protein n=1 Tax=Hymenoscyphus albidus TaxID=595503 RepID=A0A9N9M5Q6_9HELO|nr:hypothetical protein HYALB_00004607 [Hymenoscyphus albidus]